MTWKDRLNDITFSITTGDGKVFTPLWKNGEKSKEFNISKYDFINVEGSFVDRKKGQSNLHPLLFWFQGEDHIEQCNAFEDSAANREPWTIEHPFYGTLKGQPVNLSRNDNNYGITEVSVSFWESITEDLPNSDISPKDEVIGMVESVNELSAQSFSDGVNPVASDIDFVKDSAIISGSKFEADADNYTDFQNTVSKGIKASDKIVTDTLESFYSLQKILVEPANFNDSIVRKIKSYINAYESIKEGLGAVFSKYYYESQCASIIAGINLTAINPNSTDYISTNDISNVNTLMLDLYSDYLETLDTLQVDIYDVNNSWTPNVDIQTQLSLMVSFTSQQLFTLSFNARQEREYQLLEDSNLIILTHRFVGLDANDQNLEEFRQLNNIRNNELYKIKKDRIIKYYAD